MHDSAWRRACACLVGWASLTCAEIGVPTALQSSPSASEGGGSSQAGQAPPASSAAALEVPPITALGPANSPNYLLQVRAALQVLNLPPVNSAAAASPARSRRLIFFNRTSTTLWVGAAGDTHGQPLVGGGGWLMDPDTRVVFTVPMPFTSARFWARPTCEADPDDPTCGTPSCTGPDRTSCTLAGALSLTTLFEINMGSQGTEQDFYDISNVDAYNLPIAVIPVPGSYSGANPEDPFSCGSIVFAHDLNAACPPALQSKNSRTGAVVACQNQCAVEGLKDIALCTTCVGAAQCSTNALSLALKNACPGCYSFPYDDPTSTYACLGADYEVVFGATGRAVFLEP